MEGNRKTQIRVGIFLGLGLLAAVISILALGGDKSLFRSYFRLFAKMDQVQGLNTGSVVSLSGVTIGNIEEIKFEPEAQSLVVVMKIDKRYQQRIGKDATVEIRTQGALGDKFIYMTPGSSESPRVSGGDMIESAKSSDIMAMIAEKGAEAGKIFEVISEVHKLVKTMNGDGRSEKMMKNLAEASANFKEASAEAKALIGEMRGQTAGTLAASLKKLDSIMTKIDRGEGTLGALINDPQLHDQLKAVLGGSPRKQYFQSILQNSIEKKEK